MGISNLVKQFSPLIQNPQSEENEESWKNAIQNLYSFIKKEEKNLDFISNNHTLPKIYVDNMNSEQIWQQLELQNNALIPNVNQVVEVDDSNLCTAIAQLCNKVNSEDDKEEEEEEQCTTEDEGVESGEEEEELSLSEIGSVDSNEREKDIDEWDLDADTFADIVLDEEDEDEKERQEENVETSQINNQKNFTSSSLDTQFLNLRESEWIADNDIIGKDFGDINLLEDIDPEGSEDEGVNAMYDNFFDDPEGPQQEQPETSQSGEEDEEDDTNSIQDKFFESDEETKEPSDANIPQETSKEENKANAAMTKFEKAIDAQKCIQDNLVEDFMMIENKPWVLQGEVHKNERPKNSTLEEHLEFTLSVRPKPIITEETTAEIEKLLLSRIRNQAWDDVERRIKPNADPFNYKKKLILDQEKSKKSLAEIYEEEFLKKQADKTKGLITATSALRQPDQPIEELPIHKEIRSKMDDLFMKMDALSNFHFTPKYKPPEIKLVKDAAAITIEESTPVTIADATLLAPQEVLAPLRGELVGESEKTTTDKKRERRRKKKYQKAKAHKEEQKLKTQLKKKDDGLMSTDLSTKVVEKAFKKGQIGVLERDESSASTPAGFLKQFETNMSEKGKKRKFGADDVAGGKKKKQTKQVSIAQLLLS